MRNFVYGALVAFFLSGFLWIKVGHGGMATNTVYRSDTVYMRDTVRDTVLVPQKVYLTRTDTVKMYTADTVQVPVLIPIERREYRTDDYFAVIEGYQPSLVKMELYPQVRHVTVTETKNIAVRRRWGVGIQAGYGLSRCGASPYVGVGVQYNIVSW